MPGIPSTKNQFCIAECNLLHAFCNDCENGKQKIVEGGIAFFANASSLEPRFDTSAPPSSEALISLSNANGIISEKHRIGLQKKAVCNRRNANCLYKFMQYERSVLNYLHRLKRQEMFSKEQNQIVKTGYSK